MTLDHLVIAAPNLEIGAHWLLERTGVQAQTGGKHTLMGTHNLLARLGTDTYLEIIATDPNAPKPPRARWFNLDQPILEPRLIHWVARTNNLENTPNLEQHGIITPITRGVYQWKITIPEDGHLPEHGIIPTLIEWQSQNPSSSLEPNGLTLIKLEAFHPEPNRIQTHLQTLNLEMPVQYASTPRLEATLETPKGVIRF
jgi:Glyoxalase-like domain